jgi:hypothetical protein
VSNYPQLPQLGDLMRVVEKDSGEDPRQNGTLFLLTQELTENIWMLTMVGATSTYGGEEIVWNEWWKDHKAWKPSDKIELLMENKTNDPTEKDNGWWGTLFVNGDLPKDPFDGTDIKLQEKVEWFVLHSPSN